MKVTNKRKLFVEALNEMDELWMQSVENKEFYNINYSDLFTGLWLADKPVRKQDAVNFVRFAGAQTATKYLDRAIKEGLVAEVADPRDGRAKLVQLSQEMKKRLESFIDLSIKQFKTALRD